MKIQPIVSNIIEIELKGGSVFEIYEGSGDSLEISAKVGHISVSQLNLQDIEWEVTFKDSRIRILNIEEA